MLVEELVLRIQGLRTKAGFHFFVFAVRCCPRLQHLVEVLLVLIIVVELVRGYAPLLVGKGVKLSNKLLLQAIEEPPEPI